MPRLFVFGIGGTGSRVIKSLTMLLASGLRAGDFDLVPILIDPHKELKELNECKVLLKLYSTIHDQTYDKSDDRLEGFFKTRILTLKSLSSESGLKDDFEFDEKYDSTFAEFLQLSSIDKNSPTHDLLSLLYSEENFNKPLSLGFKGNPNVGSVVLNALKDSIGFKAFQSSFGAEDRIFIISSIFGGTGAAGFPLLLKKFRNHSIPSIKECQIGALTVMPYFKLSEPIKYVDEISNEEKLSSDIDSNNFLTKTKSALTYYSRPEFSELYNSLFYIADLDQHDKPYQNNEKDQNNKAHVVELLGALSIIEFAGANNTSKGEVYEYSLKRDGVKSINFMNIADETSFKIGKNFTDLFIFSRLHYENKSNTKLPFNKSEFTSLYDKETKYFSNLDDFFKLYYNSWIAELSENDRPFYPLNIYCTSEFTNLVIGKEISKRRMTGILFKPFGLSQIHLEMSKSASCTAMNKLGAKNQIAKYMAVCFNAIDKVVNDNITF